MARDDYAKLQTVPGSVITSTAKANNSSLVAAAKSLNASSSKTVGSSTPSAKSVSSAAETPVSSADTTSTSGVVQPSFQDLISQASAAVDSYNAQSQVNAEAQWKFNAEEAQKSRDWQEYMSNTAHQREVADLLAAGLNPVLSAGGTGASVTSGATASGSQADVSDSMVSVFGNYINTLVNSATAIAQSNINAKASENVASMYNAMNYKIAKDFPTTDKYLGSVLESILGQGGSSGKSIASSVLDKLSDLFSKGSSSWNLTKYDYSNFEAYSKRHNKGIFYQYDDWVADGKPVY